LPLTVSYYGVGTGAHRLQLGGGMTLLYVWGGDSSVGPAGVSPILTTVVGYRYLPRGGGFNFGIGLTPSVAPASRSPFSVAWLGISFGGGF
jgi:hypothetical protein